LTKKKEIEECIEKWLISPERNNVAKIVFRNMIYVKGKDRTDFLGGKSLIKTTVKE